MPSAHGRTLRLPIGSLRQSRLGSVAGAVPRSVVLGVAAVALIAASAIPTVLGVGGHSATALDALPPGPVASANAPVVSPSPASIQDSITGAASLAMTPAGTNPSGSPAAIPGQAPTIAGFDPIDLATKGLLVAALLFLTLRALRHLQSGPATRGSRLAVLESRTLASKASLHLVGIGERRIVVGLTPSGMVALAELDTSDLPELDTAQHLAPGSMEASAAATRMSTSGRGRGIGSLPSRVGGLGLDALRGFLS